MIPITNFKRLKPAAAFVQAQTTIVSATSTSASLPAFSAAPLKSDLIVCSIIYDTSTGGAITSVTDTQGNTYAMAVNRASLNSSNESHAIWYAQNIIGGGSSVQVTLHFSPASGYIELECHEYSGIAAVALDTAAGAGSTSSTTAMSAGTVTVHSTKSLLFAHFQSANTTTVGSGYTSVSSVNGNIGESKAINAVGAATLNATQSPAGTWDAVGAAFYSK